MAREAVLYIAVTLDGYIADSQGGVNFLEGIEDGGYEKFIKGVDTLLMGRKTYQQIITELSPEKWPYTGLKCYVLTTGRQEKEDANAEFFSGDVVGLLLRLKAQTGGRIWIAGGAQTINQMIQEDVIEEYQITILPVLLGDGIRLFKHGNPVLPLQLEDVRREKQTVTLIYRRVRQ